MMVTSQSVTVDRKYGRMILNAFPDPVFLTTSSRRIQFVNTAASKLLGSPFEGLLGQRLEKFLTKEDSPNRRIYTSRGDEIPVVVSDQKLPERLKDFFGKSCETITIVRDIREILSAYTQQIERLQQGLSELHHTKGQLLQSTKLSAMGQMAAGLAHELNTPLTTIRSSCEFLLDKLKSGDLTKVTLKKFVQRMHRVSESAGKVIEHFRLFSRDVKQEMGKVDLSDVVKDVFMMFGERIRIRRIMLKQSLAHGAYVLGSKQRLEEVLINLINNAVDAMTLSSNKQLIIQTACTNGQAILRVKDTGCGIRQEYTDRLFTPFFTTKSDGTGLGLSVSYGIIREHNGTINIQSIPDKGTVVEVKLPLCI